MAVPDWPLSFGSLNPAGWWENFPVRLEHGHRLFASIVGLLTTILCAWVWRNGWPLLWAALASIVLTTGARLIHLPPIGVMHTSIWSFAGAFAAFLLTTSQPVDDAGRAVRWTAFWAFIAVCLQATLGGLRVTRETAGFLQLAFALRVFHACVAQAFLCLVVATATLLSPRWQTAPTAPRARARAASGLDDVRLHLRAAHLRRRHAPPRRRARDSHLPRGRSRRLLDAARPQRLRRHQLRAHPHLRFPRGAPYRPHRGARLPHRAAASRCSPGPPLLCLRCSPFSLRWGCSSSCTPSLRP